MQRLCGAIWRFWLIRGHIAEGRRRLDAALEADSRATIARGRTLNGATVMASETGDPVAARHHAEEAIDLHQVIDDPWGEAISLGLLGSVHAAQRDFEGAQQLFEAALARHQRDGDDHRVLVAMDNLAWMRDELGDVSGARALTEEVIRIARAADNLRMQASSLSTLGVYALREDRVAEALPLLEESFRISRDLDDSEAYFVLYCFAWALAIARRAADATRVYSVAEAFRQETGRSAAGPFLERENEWTLARVHAQLDEGAFAQAWDEGTRMTVDEAVALALEEGEPDA